MLVKTANTEFVPAVPPVAYQPATTVCPGAGGGPDNTGGGGSDPNPGDSGGGGSDPPVCHMVTYCIEWGRNDSLQAGAPEQICVGWRTQELCD